MYTLTFISEAVLIIINCGKVEKKLLCSTLIYNNFLLLWQSHCECPNQSQLFKLEMLERKNRLANERNQDDCVSLYLSSFFAEHSQLICTVVRDFSKYFYSGQESAV